MSRINWNLKNLEFGRRYGSPMPPPVQAEFNGWIHPRRLKPTYYGVTISVKVYLEFETKPDVFRAEVFNRLFKGKATTVEVVCVPLQNDEFIPWLDEEAMSFYLERTQLSPIEKLMMRHTLQERYG